MPKAQRGTHKLYALGGTQDGGETWDISYGDGTGKFRVTSELAEFHRTSMRALALESDTKTEEVTASSCDPFRRQPLIETQCRSSSAFSAQSLNRYEQLSELHPLTSVAGASGVVYADKVVIG